MHHEPRLLIFFGELAGLSMWLQVVLSLFLRRLLRKNGQALHELFAFGPLGSLSFRKPYLMRMKFFFPWVKAGSIQDCPPHVSNLAWAARLSGTLFLATGLGIVCSLAYQILSGA
jgi:hypothetical protein